MGDIVPREQRSYNMSRIRGKNTKPEILVRSKLHEAGLRFTVNGPRNRELPGKPDIVLPFHKTVVFVHGCFWHGHEGCPKFRLPKTRREWWKAKIERTKERDEESIRLLREEGWNVVVIWECSIRELLAKQVPEFREFIIKNTQD
jgi:DNA mismatch endonuclease (patch repair protein)